MNRRSWIQHTILPLCVLIAAQQFAIIPTAQGQESSHIEANPLLAELSKADFVEHTADEVRKELEGKKLIGLYFTAKWCAACRPFTPKVVKIRNEDPEVFQFVVVSWDDSLENEQAYLEKAKMHAPAIRFDDPLVGEFNKRYRVNGVPTLLIFDEDGEMVTPSGWQSINWTLRPGALEQLGDSEAALAWRMYVAPFQETNRAKRQAAFEQMKPVLDKYKDFPRIDEIADWLGYTGGSKAVNETMHKVGKEMAADWENQKRHLDYLADLAVALKPQTKGYIGALEGSGASGLFEELGKASNENPEILATLNRFAKSHSSLRKNWGLAGLVAAAVKGNDDAMERVIAWKETVGGASHAPLHIYPILYPACSEGDARALKIAKQIYENDPYYVYKAIAAFVAPALDGNETALEALGLIAAAPDGDRYGKYAVQVLDEAAAKGHDKAKQILDALPTAEDDSEI